MARQQSAAEFNTFIAGLITEASPLTFPNNSSRDEENFILHRDGKRTRRYGIDLEASSSEITSTVSLPSDGNIAYSSVIGKNAGGNSEKNIVVVQIGNEINFFDGSSVPLSSGYIYTDTYSASLVDVRFSYAVVAGYLVVANGNSYVTVYKYDNTTDTITKSSKSLYIRDLFGVTDIAT
jgi:hypothetical protein